MKDIKNFFSQVGAGIKTGVLEAVPIVVSNWIYRQAGMQPSPPPTAPTQPSPTSLTPIQVPPVAITSPKPPEKIGTYLLFGGIGFGVIILIIVLVVLLKKR